LAFPIFGEHASIYPEKPPDAHNLCRRTVDHILVDRESSD